MFTIQTHLVGGYNFDNANAAICLGRYFGVDPFDIKAALEGYQPSNNRSQYKETASNRLILDCYNANPSSMTVALENFAAMQADNKVAILGSMKELGADSAKEHKAICSLIAASGIGQAILIGDEFRMADGKPGMTWLPDTDAACQHLRQHPLQNSTVLVKGSNSNHLWQLEQWL